MASRWTIRRKAKRKLKELTETEAEHSSSSSREASAPHAIQVGSYCNPDSHASEVASPDSHASEVTTENVFYSSSDEASYCVSTSCSDGGMGPKNMGIIIKTCLRQ